MAAVANSRRRSGGPQPKLYRKLENPAVVQALAHPLRARILSVLEEREASPKELAEHLNSPLPNIAYHIQVLRKLKVIRLVKKTPRRGAVEHHYIADHAVHIDDEAWSQTPGLIKEQMIAGLLEEIGEHATEAAGISGFDDEDAHISHSRLVLDRQAWSALSAKLAELLDWGYELQKESAVRLKRSNHEDERRAGFVMMLYESAPSVPNADEAGEFGRESRLHERRSADSSTR
jgi:DNA-binding transcriptional ArsR family regulator